MSTPIAEPRPAEIHYFTVIVPYVEPKRATEWHPDRPGEKLSRGAFPSLDAACAWAKDHLAGTPYGVTEVGWDEERGDWSRVVKSYCYAEVYAHIQARIDGGQFGATTEIVAAETGLPLEQVSAALGAMGAAYDRELDAVLKHQRPGSAVCPRCLDLTPGEAGGDPAHPHPGPFTEALCLACSRAVEAALRSEGRTEAANYEAAQRHV